MQVVGYESLDILQLVISGCKEVLMKYRIGIKES